METTTIQKHMETEHDMYTDMEAGFGVFRRIWASISTQSQGADIGVLFEV